MITIEKTESGYSRRPPMLTYGSAVSAHILDDREQYLCMTSCLRYLYGLRRGSVAIEKIERDSVSEFEQDSVENLKTNEITQYGVWVIKIGTQCRIAIHPLPSALRNLHMCRYASMGNTRYHLLLQTTKPCRAS